MARQAGVAVAFHLGNASAMPFADESFDFIVCRAAFKSFTAPVQAIREMHRVLRPGSTALIQDLRGDARRADIDAYVDTLGLNPINRLLTRWTLAFLRKNAYTPDAMRAIVAQTDFARCTIDEETIGMSVWLER
jgi:ubiquinone/menaquinone biosynthesis C-methylase UbiE